MKREYARYFHDIKVPLNDDGYDEVETLYRQSPAFSVLKEYCTEHQKLLGKGETKQRTQCPCVSPLLGEIVKMFVKMNRLRVDLYVNRNLVK